MSYVVLARKWRPQSFEDLVGQEHVSKTLESAIAAGRVAHAFLFTGVRGVGKTTSARILAKALNCAQGPTARPCQVCPQCVEITAGSDVDVQEIDGASYNGIDEVRRLQESLPYRPARDRSKIFIVDEVHMLSNAAWNAFLKTLEEPPPHVKFIFATTEVHKVPVTILSRCQRYDFKLIAAQTIAARLRFVLEAEGVPADDAAIGIIAREAAGSMRDAMSLLDQVIAWVGGGGARLTADGVARVLGVAARSVLHRLADALVAGDAATCVAIVGELAQQGFDLPHVARDLLSHLRDLVVAKVCAEPGELLDLADEEVRDVRALAGKADVDDLTRLHLGFSRSFDDIVRSGQPRASLEMALVRMARRPPLLPVDELLRRLADLERRLDPAGGGGGPARSGAGGAPGRGAPPGGRPPARAAEASGPTPNAEVRLAPPGPAPVTRPAQPPPERPAMFQPQRFEMPRIEPPAPQAAPPPVARPVASGRDARPAGETPGAPPPKAAPPNVDIAGWRAVLATIHAKRPAIASVLEHAAVLAFGPERVVLGYEPNSFLSGHATDAVARDLLVAAVREHFAGAATDVTIDVASSRDGAVTVAQLDGAERKARVESAKRAVAEHPLVAEAIQVLGAELRDVRLGSDLADN